MTTYSKCSRCKHSSKFIYEAPCYFCKHGSEFKLHPDIAEGNEGKMGRRISLWYQQVIELSKDIQKFSSCLDEFNILKRAIAIEAIANNYFENDFFEKIENKDTLAKLAKLAKDMQEIELREIKERAESLYQKELDAYAKTLDEYTIFSVINLGDINDDILLCVGKILGYTNQKIHNDIEEAYKKMEKARENDKNA